MPRRVKPQDESPFEPTGLLMLPPARKHGTHEHKEDPYEVLPGAVPPMETTRQPLKRKQSAGDVLTRKRLRAEQKALGARYNRYLEARADCGGDKIAALAVVFGLEIDEVAVRQDELHMEVMRGVASSSVAELLEANDLNLAARAKLYAKHAWSNVPAASLKALQEIGELEGERQDQGSFESFLRLAKNQRGV